MKIVEVTKTYIVKEKKITYGDSAIVAKPVQPFISADL